MVHCYVCDFGEAPDISGDISIKRAPTFLTNVRSFSKITNAATQLACEGGREPVNEARLITQ